VRTIGTNVDPSGRNASPLPQTTIFEAGVNPWKSHWMAEHQRGIVSRHKVCDAGYRRATTSIYLDCGRKAPALALKLRANGAGNFRFQQPCYRSAL